MADTGDGGSASGRAIVKRLRRSVAEKRQIVEATLAPGASVAQVAREHGVNDNQLFYWRRLYRDGSLGVAAEPGALIPVRVKPERAAAGERPAAEPGALHLELRHGRLSVENGCDAHLLRMVLEHLIG